MQNNQKKKQDKKQKQQKEQEVEQEDYQKLVESRRQRQIQILQDVQEIRQYLSEKQPIQLVVILKQLMEIQYSKIEKEQEKYEIVEECYLLIINNYLMENPKINECNDFITTIFRDYNTGCQKLCKILLTTLFDRVLDLQTKITPNKNEFQNIDNFLSKQLDFNQLNEDEKNLALVIIICNSIISSLVFNLTYIDLIRELLVKIIRTTSYFYRIKETIQFIKVIDKNLIISEEMNEDDKIKCQRCISELRVDIVPCILNLPIQDIIYENIYKAVEFLPEYRQKDHINNIIKFLSIQQEWVSMCYALRSFIHLFGFNNENKNYAIESLILGYSQEGGKSKIKVSNQIRYICLEQKHNQWLDATCSNRKDSTPVEDCVNYLLSYCIFEQKFLDYCQKYLKINYQNYQNYDLKTFIEEGIKTVHELAKENRIYCMYSNQQIVQIISNSLFYYLTVDNKQNINVREVYNQIGQYVSNINKDYWFISYKDFKLIIIKLMKMYPNQFKVDYKKNTITGTYQDECQINQKVKEFMDKKIQINIQQEKLNFTSMQAKQEGIKQRAEEIKERYLKINEENEQKEQERLRKQKEQYEAQQREQEEKLKKKRQQKIAIAQCQLFIEEAGLTSSNPKIQTILQQKLNEMIGNPQIPFITYVNELNEILERQKQCQNDQIKQAYPQYIHSYVPKDQLIQNAQEYQDKQNKIIQECSEARYQADMKEYEANIKFIEGLQAIDNLQQVIDDCDRIVNAEYYRKLDEYNKKLQEKEDEIKQKELQAKKEYEEMIKQKEATKQEKGKKGKSKLEQLRAQKLLKQKQQQQN